MRAGRLKRRVTLQGATRTSDSYGGNAVEWVDLATVWAGVQYGTGSERVQSLLQQAEANVAVVIRYRADVTPGQRVRTDDLFELFDILSVTPDERWSELVLACKLQVL